MKIFTIGFTRSTAEKFFGRLRRAKASALVDVRLSNGSQLAGFAKRDDLAWLVGELCGIPYRHALELAPTAGLLDAYRKRHVDWEGYANAFGQLIRDRQIETADPATFDGACLLCSEEKPHRCHRRLVAEYLASHWPDVEIVHL
jgi:uncharacterized protein (DUF488 family)